MIIKRSHLKKYNGLDRFKYKMASFKSGQVNNLVAGDVSGEGPALGPLKIFTTQNDIINWRIRFFDNSVHGFYVKLG